MATASSSKVSPFLSGWLLRYLRFSSAAQSRELGIRKVPNLNPSSLIDLISSDPDPISAVRLFRWASCQRNFRQTPATYAHLVFKLGLAGKSEEMEEFLKEMVRFNYPDADSSLQSLVESFCRYRRPREALKVFEIASLAKFRHSISACNVLLSAVIAERLDLDVVLFVYKEMAKAGILPNVETLNCLIQGLIENGMMELALDQFERMEKKNCRPDGRTFEIVIAGLCSSGRVDEAIRTWNRMLAIGCIRNHEFYKSIISWFCRIRRLDEAIKLFGLMKSDGFLPDLYVFSVLIQHFCDDLRLNDAIEVFEEMVKSGFTPITCMYVDIVNAYCKLGDFCEAMRFLEGNGVSEAEPYNALLHGLCDGRRVQEATCYLNKIEEMGLNDSHSWNILINCLCKEGFVRKALEVLGRMIVSSGYPDTDTYSYFVTGFCKNYSYDSALDWFREGLVKNTSFDSESCSELTKGLCLMGRVQEAVEVFFSISSKGCILDTDALNILVQCLCIAGKVSEAIKLCSIAFSHGTPSTLLTYEIVMLTLLDLKKEKDLLPLLSQMLIEGCTLTSRTYRMMICGLCVESTIWNAALLFNQMIQDGFVPDAETLERLVHSACKCRQLHLVVNSLDKVIEVGGLSSPRVCNAAIYGLLKEGHKNEACGLLDRMLDKGWVPDSATHGLLVGAVDAEERDVTGAYEDGDGVSIILSEGLREAI